MERHSDVIVAGGGLAGLAAAAYLARAGRRVTVLEKAEELGGRARTRERSGFLFNVGPHALYVAGQARAVLRELEVPFTGQPPLADGTFVAGRRRDRAVAGRRARAAVEPAADGRRQVGARARARATPRLDASAADGVSLSDWLRRNVRHDSVAELLRTFFRVATFVDEPDRLSAGAAIAQLQLALQKNVLYLDGGWQTLVDGLARRVREAGARIVTRADVGVLEHDGGRVRGVRLANGDVWTAPFVLAALAPDAVGGARGPRGRPADGARARPPGDARPRPRPPAAAGTARRLRPGAAALLLRALRGRAPRPRGHGARTRGVLPRRRPAPAGRDRGRAPGLRRPRPAGLARARGRAPLRAGADRRARAAVSRAKADSPGRPAVAVRERPGLFVAGDWVGPEGLLADAALASARSAAAAILRAGADVAAA